MKIIKLANVVVQIHVRDEYSGQRVLYCPWVNCTSIIVMVNALIKIVMAVIAVALY